MDDTMEELLKIGPEGRLHHDRKTRARAERARRRLGGGLVDDFRPNESGNLQRPAPVVITEGSSLRMSTFALRQERYNGQYTAERALEAFRSYVRRRDATKEERGVKLSGNRRLSFGIELPSETLFNCLDEQDAMRRVVELVGPVPKKNDAEEYLRGIIYGKFGEYKNAREKREAIPALGFCAMVTGIERREVAFSTQRAWRLDYDPNKGFHINVLIQAPIIVSGSQVGFYSRRDPESLSIAFVFFSDRERYLELVGRVNSQIIDDQFSEDDLFTNYLPINSPSIK